MNVTLAGAVALLVVWGVLVFGAHATTGAVHGLYAVAAVLVARRILVGAPKFLS